MNRTRRLSLSAIQGSGMTIQRPVLYREALSSVGICMLLVFSLAMGGSAGLGAQVLDKADRKYQSAESSAEVRVKLTNLALEGSLIKMARLVEGLPGEAEDIAMLASHLYSAAAAIKDEDEKKLKISFKAAEEGFAKLGLGRADLLKAGIVPPSNLAQLDAIAVRQPLPVFFLKGGQPLASNVFWGILCLGGYLECLTHSPVSTCNEMLELCFGVCLGGAEGPSIGTGGPRHSPCTPGCQQVKQDASAPLVTINPASGCQNPPLVSAVSAAFIADVTGRVTHGWQDDPANTCGADCFCHGEGDGALTATRRRRYDASAALNGCALTGSVSVELKKRRRAAECLPN